MTEDKEKDDDYVCGVKPFETGKWDPLIEPCIPHDDRFKKHFEGKKTPSNWVTQRDFTTGILSTTAVNIAKAAYSIVFAVPYVVLGAGAGAIRWWAKSPGTESLQDAKETIVQPVHDVNAVEAIPKAVIDEEHYEQRIILGDRPFDLKKPDGTP